MRFGVEVIPGEGDVAYGDDQRYLRFPYSAEPPVLEETVRRLAQAGAAYAPSDATHPPAPIGRRLADAPAYGSGRGLW